MFKFSRFEANPTLKSEFNKEFPNVTEIEFKIIAKKRPGLIIKLLKLNIIREDELDSSDRFVRTALFTFKVEKAEDEGDDDAVREYAAKLEVVQEGELDPVFVAKKAADALIAAKAAEKEHMIIVEAQKATETNAEPDAAGFDIWTEVDFFTFYTNPFMHTSSVPITTYGVIAGYEVGSLTEYVTGCTSGDKDDGIAPQRANKRARTVTVSDESEAGGVPDTASPTEVPLSGKIEVEDDDL